MPSASPDLLCVDPTRVKEIWPHVKHLIRSAIESTGLSRFENIEAQVLDGDQLLWIIWDGKQIIAAGSTRLANNVCEIVSVGGGKLSDWKRLHTRIEDYARDEGCSRVRIIGRRGWERVLDGYKPKHVILEKAL